ncbi:unnamed protein product [Candida verbasci]|uniref:Uncharacterized protein n=1 Tax=Candida verbasci TaxID=1227364 RepID=A0A9W4XC72_9ASCO|nr:unnamed protein product [Candida verbasci]
MFRQSFAQNLFKRSFGIRSLTLNAFKKPSPSTFKFFFASSGASFLLFNSFSKIYNDTAALQQQSLPINDIKSNIKVNEKGYTESRFNNYLNYQELTIGSVTGLFLGIIIGKLSQVFLFVTLSSYLLLEFLQSRNVINIPWNKIVSIGKEKIDIKQLVFEKPSFKISFILSLIIAAYNV